MVKAAAADGEGTAGREASDDRGAARLAGVESGGIAQLKRDCSQITCRRP